MKDIILRYKQIFLIIALFLSSCLCSCSNDSFKFAVISDVQPLENETVKVNPIYLKQLETIKKINPEFLIFDGDMIGGYSENYNTLKTMFLNFKKSIKDLKFKSYFVAGNHDKHNSIASRMYEKYFGKTYYSFNYRNTHFIILDTELYPYKRKISGPQLAWLKRDLSENQNKNHIMVFLHRPLYPVKYDDKYTGLNMYPTDRNNLHNLFKKNNVEYVFAGHEHLFSRQKNDGINYFIIGGGGGKLLHKSLFFHFITVKVFPEKVKVYIHKLKDYKKQPGDYYNDNTYLKYLKNQNN